MSESLSEMHRVLKPCGVIGVSSPDWSNICFSNANVQMEGKSLYEMSG